MSKNKKKGGFMSGLSNFGKAALDKANSAMKDVKNFVTNPKHNFHEGNILGLISSTTDKCLMVSAGGIPMCSDYQKQYKTDRFCQFEVMPGGSVHPHSIKLRCVANHLYLGLCNGMITGCTGGGPECDFLVHSVDNEQGSPKWVGLESASAPGYHIGVLPTGQLCSPAYTKLENTAAHFSVECVERKEHTAQNPYCAGAPPPPCDSSHLSISCDDPDLHCSLSPCHTVHTVDVTPAASYGTHASVSMTIPGAPVIVGNAAPPAVVLATPVVMANTGPSPAVITVPGPGNPYPPPAPGNPYPPPAPGNPYPPPAPGSGNPYPPPAPGCGNPYPPPAPGNPYPPPAPGNPYPPPAPGNPYPPPAPGNPYPPPAPGNPYPPPVPGNPYPPPAPGNPYPPPAAPYPPH